MKKTKRTYYYVLSNVIHLIFVYCRNKVRNPDGKHRVDAIAALTPQLVNHSSPL